MSTEDGLFNKCQIVYLQPSAIILWMGSGTVTMTAVLKPSRRQRCALVAPTSSSTKGEILSPPGLPAPQLLVSLVKLEASVIQNLCSVYLKQYLHKTCVCEAETMVKKPK